MNEAAPPPQVALDPAPLLLPALIGLSRLRFNVEVLDLLPADVPAVQGLKSYQQHFANTRELILTLQGTDAVQAELAAGALATRLTRDLDLAVQWEAPWRAQPQAIAELLAFVWFNHRPAEIARLTQRLAPRRFEPSLEQLRDRLATSHSPVEIARAGYDPLGLTFCRLPPRAICPTSAKVMKCSPPRMEPSGCCMSKTGPRRPGYRESERWLDQVADVVARWQQDDPAFSQLAVGFTGQPAHGEMGGGMERDMIRSVAGTLLIIATLFLWVHRRLTPLLWLLALLTLTLVGALGFGGLWFGTLNVVSTGFAAILLGLAVDYGLVLYQEAQAQPETHRASAATPARAQYSLGSRDHLRRFPRPQLQRSPGARPTRWPRDRRHPARRGADANPVLAPLLPLPAREWTARLNAPNPRHTSRSPLKLVVFSTGLLLGVLAFILFRGLPGLDRGAEALRPRHQRRLPRPRRDQIGG